MILSIEELSCYLVTKSESVEKLFLKKNAFSNVKSEIPKINLEQWLSTSACYTFKLGYNEQLETGHFCSF